jgi:hypothetical protein
LDHVIGLGVFIAIWLAGCAFLVYFLVALWLDAHKARSLSWSRTAASRGEQTEEERRGIADVPSGESARAKENSLSALLSGLPSHDKD